MSGSHPEYSEKYGARIPLMYLLDNGFTLGISWHPDWGLVTSLNGHFLPKVNGKNLLLSTGTIPSYMHLGKPNNGDVMYGNFTIDELYFWNYVLDTESMKMIYDQY